MTSPLGSPGPALPKISRRNLVRAAGLGVGALAVPGVLTACSGADTTTTPGSSSSGLAGVEPKQLGAETPGVLYADGYVGPRARSVEKFGDGTTVFKVVVATDAEIVGDWNKNTMTDWFEKRTGVKCEFTQVLTTASDGSTDMTKINAMLASGDLPDAFLGLPFTNDQISLYGQQGIFLALDDYIATYAPEMRQTRTDYPDFAKLTAATDGKTYQFAGINDCYHCKSSPGRAWINTTYLDQIGAKMPTTTDELRQVLKEFKDNDPTPKKNIIPFGSSVGDQVDRFIMNAFLYNPGGDIDSGWLALNDGKVELVATKDEWREGLRYLNQLYKDGTVTRQTFTMSSDTLQQVGNQGRLGFVRAYSYFSFIDVGNGKGTGALYKDYAAVPPLKGPSGYQGAWWDYYGYPSQMMLVTSKCKQPEILVQWADAQMELEAIMHGYGGEQGNWNWSKQGQVGINEKQSLFNLDVWPAPKGTSWSQYSIMYRANDFRLGQEIDPNAPNFEADLYKAGKEYEPFAEPQDQQLPPLIFDAEAAAAKADTAASIYQQVRQSLAQFSVGEKNIDDDNAWNDYKSSFDAMGLSNYLDIYQQAYDKAPK